MPVIKDKPKGIKSSNALDDIHDPNALPEVPPAYLSFGTTPCALDNPPIVDEVRTYVVRARCSEVHGPLKRKDGEMRHTRTLVIQGCWESGKQPTDADSQQPGLFDHGDQGDDEAGGDEPQTVGEVINGSSEFTPTEFSDKAK